MTILGMLKSAACAALLLSSALTNAAAIPDHDLSPRSGQSLPVRLMSFNIRFAASPSGNEKAWSDRKNNLINQVAYEASTVDTTLVGMQEVLKTQLDDIVSGLNRHPTASGRDWAYIGVGRDDGKEQGEYSPILYRKSVWDVLKVDTKWLSETPNVPSFGWGATNRRILTTGILRHKRSRDVIIAMNTHLDHQVSDARLHGAELILKLIDQFRAKKTNYNCDIVGVALTGDFNSQEDQEAYQKFSSSKTVADAGKRIPQDKWYGNQNTFTGFDSEVGMSRIDYVFFGAGNSCRRRSAGKGNVKSYAVLPNKFDDGTFFSDHRAVVSDIIFG
ncbi:hypothetical protein AJ80_00553 [Polytolypa hystricis UAMH7299]|uniref:Endonuclease/exonuclease/phosphatase domain-containing protein n=1 Tax=Polytolypa hystricis (strain UAMH7299) TaxID=1447883 RepID=A0A2B7Z2C2_POLH7|nr:hypothetical protein AJ80_00553 [Polytolypa hystricis UAMH7299]